MVDGWFLAESRFNIHVYIIPYIPLLRGIIRYFTQITSALSERNSFSYFVYKLFGYDSW